MAHNLMKVTRERLKKQVIIIIRHAVCVISRIVSLRGGLKIFEKFLTVTLAFKNSFAFIST
jgi:hypothetical protein